MMLRNLTVALLLSGVAGVASAAGPANALSSCFTFAKLPVPTTAPAIEVFVMVDQTTPFNADLKQSIADHIKPLLVSGNALSIYAFSAYTQGHYTNELVHAELDPALEPATRNDIGKTALARYDQCEAYQVRTVQTLAGNALRQAFHGDGNEISKSDVLASIQDVSRQVKASSAQRKIVLIASDMLENSSISSFYAKRAVRKINPDQETRRVADNNLTGDFGGAEIYVLGAGLIVEDTAAKGVYRDPQTMRALQQFWQRYFDGSHGKLVEFGAPALLSAIH